MLINNAIQIISNGRAALGDLALEIAQNQQQGLNAIDDQAELRRRLVLTYACLNVLDRIIVINEDDEIDYILDDYDNEKINRILLFLKGVSKQKNNPIVHKLLNPIVEETGSSMPGPPGGDGINAYLYIGYADDGSGTGYSTSATGKNFIAVRNSTTPITPVTAATFSGLWRQFVGADGQDVYIYHAWADASDGTGFTLTFNPAKKYTAIKVTTTAIPSPVQADFAGLWAKYIGEDGADGVDGVDGDDGLPGVAGNTIISGTGAPDNSLGVDGDYYKDTASNMFYGPKAAGAWPAGVDLKGDQGDPGDDGDPGADGADGADAYVYIAYADAADGTGFTMTYSPTKYWIAILPTDVEIPSPSASNFTGLFRKYIGAGGDRYATFSTTSLTIAASGLLYLNVEANLQYTTGQYVVIALNGDPSNRMECTVVDYNPINGQMTLDILSDFGAGTYAVWDVNLLGSPTIVISEDHWRGYFDASVDEYPDPGLNAAVGSGSGGAIRGGDEWSVSVAGTISGNYYPAGTIFKALEAVPGQTDAKWRAI
jgi:hypothetical protein